MRIYAGITAILLFASLALTACVWSLPQNIDEWVALDRSLKTAKSLHPKDGFVPDESTAVKIGEAAALAQYGAATISREEPFRARLRGDLWTVKGTLHPEGSYGGTAVVQLSKTDGRILFMTHQE